MTHALTRPVSSTALLLIWMYQRWISPVKGFRCAYSVLHGGPGCSGFAKHAIRDFGIWRAVGKIRRRVRECRVAMDTLAAQRAAHLAAVDHAAASDAEPGAPDAAGPNNPRRKQRKENSYCRPSDCAGACEAPSGCCGSAASAKGGAVAGTAAVGTEAATGMCAATGEGIAGAVGGCVGGISCCG